MSDRKPSKLDSHYGTIVDSPPAPSERHYWLKEFYSFISTLFVFLSSWDMSYWQPALKKEINSGQDSQEKSLSPATDTVT